MNPLSTERGVTLVELMTVLIILTVVAGVGIGSFLQRLPHYRFNAAARDVVSDMRFARQQAASENWQYAVHFTSAYSYEIVRGDQPRLQASDSYEAILVRDNHEIPGRKEVTWNVPNWTPVFRPDGLITSANLDWGSFRTDPPEPLVMENNTPVTKTVAMSRFGRIKID